MPTCLIATDGEQTSHAICLQLENFIEQYDNVVGINVSSAEDEGGQKSLEIIEERFRERVPVETRQIHPGMESGPVEEILSEIDRTDADVLAIGLRRHTHRELFIYGTVSHELIENCSITMLLVPLEDYPPPEV